MIKDLLKYGNELETIGIIYGNGAEKRIVMLPDNKWDIPTAQIETPTHEEMKELFNQLDTLGVEGIDKTILRKTQRQIEQNVSWNVFYRDGYRCRYCNKGNGEPMTVDHIVLWEKMGASEENNLISACRKCYKTRGNMEYAQWITSAYYNKVLNEGFANLAHSTMSELAESNINMSRIEIAHEKNVNAWEIAKRVPLRNTKRNR